MTPEDLVFELAPAPNTEGQGMTPESSPSSGRIPSDAFRLTQSESLNLNALIETVEREAMQEALRRCGNNQFQAAKLLGISRYTLRRRLAQYGMTAESAEEEES